MTDNCDNSKSLLQSHFHFICENASVHGIRYLSVGDLNWAERLVWAILVGFALVGAFQACLMVSVRYQTSPLSTVVESTYYHVSKVPFPAITLCHNLRVNFDKFDEAVERFFPNATTTTRATLNILLMAIEILDFGSFDELEELLTRNVTALENVTLSELAEFMSYNCEDLFIRCWWRNKYMPCCDIFTLQRSEYGICLSFNSATSRSSPEVNRTSAWPWRVSSFNEWSALRLELKVKSWKYFNESRPLGYLAIVHNPFEWPNIAQFIPSGATSSIGIKPTSYYASPDVRNLEIAQRECLYQDEMLSHPTEAMYIKGLPYLRPNCISECRQRYSLKYCNCTLEIFYASGVYPTCNIYGLLCMNTYNDIFNYEKPPVINEYFSVEEEGMSCPCLPECDNRIVYELDIQPDLAMAIKSNDTVTLDLHFTSGEMVRYRTDITFGWLDLLVAFGGVVGLFLGSSLLSGAELIYFLTIGLYYRRKRANMRVGSAHFCNDEGLFALRYKEL